MKISVIVPTYKPQSYLWECLDSIAAQTFPKEDFEVLLVLNGCCEPYNGQIKAWLSKHYDLQVRYIQTDVPGVSNARNIALDMASGEYVTFIDDDDYVSSDFLSELYRNASPNTISVCYPYAFNDEKPKHQIYYGLTEVYDYCVKNGCNTITSKARKFFSGPWMKLIDMSFIQGRRFDVRFKNGEDSLFMFLISDKFKKISFASKGAVYYRRFRVNSAVTVHRGTQERVLNNLRSIREYVRMYMRGGYNTFFFLTRILAETRGILLAPINSRK